MFSMFYSNYALVIYGVTIVFFLYKFSCYVLGHMLGKAVDVIQQQFGLDKKVVEKTLDKYYTKFVKEQIQDRLDNFPGLNLLITIVDKIEIFVNWVLNIKLVTVLTWFLTGSGLVILIDTIKNKLPEWKSKAEASSITTEQMIVRVIFALLLVKGGVASAELALYANIYRTFLGYSWDFMAHIVDFTNWLFVPKVDYDASTLNNPSLVPGFIPGGHFKDGEYFESIDDVIVMTSRWQKLQFKISKVFSKMWAFIKIAPFRVLAYIALAILTCVVLYVKIRDVVTFDDRINEVCIKANHFKHGDDIIVAFTKPPFSGASCFYLRTDKGYKVYENEGKDIDFLSLKRVEPGHGESYNPDSSAKTIFGYSKPIPRQAESKLGSDTAIVTKEVATQTPKIQVLDEYNKDDKPIVDEKRKAESCIGPSTVTFDVYDGIREATVRITLPNSSYKLGALVKRSNRNECFVITTGHHGRGVVPKYTASVVHFKTQKAIDIEFTVLLEGSVYLDISIGTAPLSWARYARTIGVYNELMHDTIVVRTLGENGVNAIEPLTSVQKAPVNVEDFDPQPGIVGRYNSVPGSSGGGLYTHTGVQIGHHIGNSGVNKLNQCLLFNRPLATLTYTAPDEKNMKDFQLAEC